LSTTALNHFTQDIVAATIIAKSRQPVIALPDFFQWPA